MADLTSPSVGDENKHNRGPTFDKNVPWFSHEPPQISPEARALLEGYSGIPPQEVEEHVVRIVSSIALASYMSSELLFCYVLLICSNLLLIFV